MKRFRKTVGALVLSATILFTGCAGGGTAAESDGSVTVSVLGSVEGFNFLKAGSNIIFAKQMMHGIWPASFAPDVNLEPQMNSDLLDSVEVVSTDPQVVEYTINADATWSDGTQISAEDYIYLWHALSGDEEFTDTDGNAFLAANTSGYEQIASVEGSEDGKLVTVTFESPYSDWKSLFDLLMPAHIAEEVGFNSGFDNFSDALKVSGGPWMADSYADGQSFVKVRNPEYWGDPAGLSSIIFRIFADSNELPSAVKNGEIQVVNPTTGTVNLKNALEGVPGFDLVIEPNLTFQHLDFNQANEYLAKVEIRRAIANAIDRNKIVERTVGQINPDATTIGNHIFLPNQQGYVDNSGVYGEFRPEAAKQALLGAGMVEGPNGYLQPTWGSQSGQDLSFSIVSASGRELWNQIQQLVQDQLKDVGIKVEVVTLADYFSQVQQGNFDMATYGWAIDPYPSVMTSVWCSYTKPKCSSNWVQYSNSDVDDFLDQASKELDLEKATALYNEADKLLWSDMASLEIYQFQQVGGLTSSPNIENVIYNPSSLGFHWNDEEWKLG